MRTWPVVLSAAGLVACGNAMGPNGAPVDTCPEVCTGKLEGSVTWRAADGPFHVVDTLTVDTLTVEAGTQVVGAPGALIRVRMGLVAEGTAEAPVVFTAEDPGRPWGGMTGPSGWPTLLLSQVIFEHASDGIRFFTAEIADSRFRQMEGGIVVAGTIARTTMDTIGRVGPIGGRFVGSHLRVEHAVMRGSDGMGASGSGRLTLERVRILNSRRHALGAWGISSDWALVKASFCEIAGGEGDGLLIGGTAGSAIVIRNCNIYGNTGLGARVDENAQLLNRIDAVDNWWGDAEGPFGPEGDGVSVSPQVSYEPWLTEPVEFDA